MKGATSLVLRSRNLSLFSKAKLSPPLWLRVPPFPERLKGTFAEKWWQYWKTVAQDYADVAVDVVRQVRDQPWKGVAGVGLAGGSYLCSKTNPDEIHFRDTFLNYSNSFIFVGSPIRNPTAREHLQFIESCFNEGVIRRVSFGLFSVIWVDNYDRVVSLYKAQCTYLKPTLFNFQERVLDVGFFNKWWILNNKMIDWDINPEEWKSEEQTSAEN